MIAAGVGTGVGFSNLK